LKVKDPRAAFGEGIRRLREAKKMTQAELAERSDLGSWKYIGTVENARTNITLTNVVKLANGLDLSLAELMDACFPQDEKRRELLHDLLGLVAKGDEKTIRLLLGMLAEIRKVQEAD